MILYLSMYMLYEDAELALANTPAHTQHQVCIVYIQLLLYQKLYAMKYKVQFYIVSVDEIKSMQQKLNTWLTTGHMKKFETFVLHDGRIMFQCLVLKSEE